MKITKKNKSPKKIIVISASVLVLLVGYFAIAYINDFWPFLSDTSEISPQNTDKKDNNSPTKDDPAGPTPDPSFVNPPITNQPTNNTSYPIENEHYKIVQNSPTSYSITLYPIVNNPEYSDYNTQLKTYKNEVVKYLEQRYGNIDGFILEWSPSDAEGL